MNTSVKVHFFFFFSLLNPFLKPETVSQVRSHCCVYSTRNSYSIVHRQVNKE